MVLYLIISPIKGSRKAQKNMEK